MFYFPTLIIPVLLLALIYFRYVSLRLYQLAYMRYIFFEHPAFIKPAGAMPWFTTKNILLIVLAFLGWPAAGFTDFLTSYWGQFLFGTIIMLITPFIGSAIGSILVYLYVLRNPSMLSGRVVIQAPVVQYLSMAAICAWIIPFIALSFVLPHPLILGGICGLGALILLLTYTTAVTSVW